MAGRDLSRQDELQDRQERGRDAGRAGIAGFSRMSTRRTASLAVISAPDSNEEGPHRIVAPAGRLVFRRRLQRHELVQGLPTKRHREAADAFVEIAAGIVAGVGHSANLQSTFRSGSRPQCACRNTFRRCAHSPNNGTAGGSVNRSSVLVSQIGTIIPRDRFARRVRRMARPIKRLEAEGSSRVWRRARAPDQHGARAGAAEIVLLRLDGSA